RMSHIADVAANGGAGPSRSGADANPLRHGIWLKLQLVEDAGGNIFFGTPGGCPLATSKLIHEVPARLDRDEAGLIVDIVRVTNEVARPPGSFYEGALLHPCGQRQDPDEGQIEQPREVGFANCGRAA